MIFCSKNEDGELAADLALDGRKCLTRRLKPVPVGSVRAVQRKRTGRGVGFIKVISYMPHKKWLKGVGRRNMPKHIELELEANMEGFRSWEGLDGWFQRKYGGWPNPLYRIEFEPIV